MNKTWTSHVKRTKSEASDERCEQAMDKSWKNNEQFMNKLRTRNEQVTIHEQVMS